MAKNNQNNQNNNNEKKKLTTENSAKQSYRLRFTKLSYNSYIFLQGFKNYKMVQKLPNLEFLQSKWIENAVF